MSEDEPPDLKQIAQDDATQRELDNVPRINDSINDWLPWLKKQEMKDKKRVERFALELWIMSMACTFEEDDELIKADNLDYFRKKFLR